MKVLAYTFLFGFRTVLGKSLHTFNETSLDNFKQFPVSSFIFLLENVIFPIARVIITFWELNVSFIYDFLMPI